jgi:copper chaperone CopZ
MEKHLLGMPGVMYVHIHAHDGETTVDYAPSKTKLTEIMAAFEDAGLTANL